MHANVMRFSRPFIFVCLGLMHSTFAHAEGRVDIEKARAAYLARNYKEAEERLLSLVDAKTGLHDLALLSQARMYLAAARIAQGRRDEGASIFEALVLENPTFEPDPLSFPSEVINRFFDVRVQLQEKIRQAAQNAARLEADMRAKAEEDRRRHEVWLATITQMAAEERITVQNSRLVALLPFGIGQFQNRDKVLGSLLLASESALVLGSLVTVPLFLYADGRAHEQGTNVEGKAQLYQERANSIRTVNLSLVGAFAVLALTGIVQANLAYVPNVSLLKKRDLPPTARLAPSLTPLANAEGNRVCGAILGVQGTVF
jgi:hypothetical protein